MIELILVGQTPGGEAHSGRGRVARRIRRDWL